MKGYFKLAIGVSLVVHGTSFVAWQQLQGLRRIPIPPPAEMVMSVGFDTVWIDEREEAGESTASVSPIHEVVNDSMDQVAPEALLPESVNKIHEAEEPKSIAIKEQVSEPVVIRDPPSLAGKTPVTPLVVPAQTIEVVRSESPQERLPRSVGVATNSVLPSVPSIERSLDQARNVPAPVRLARTESSRMATASRTPERVAVRLSAAQYLRNPQPVYPRAARQQRQEGLTVLQVEMDERGRPTDVRVHESSGFTLLDDAALDAVRRWRFVPACVAGRPVTAGVEVPIRFSLSTQLTMKK